MFRDAKLLVMGVTPDIRDKVMLWMRKYGSCTDQELSDNSLAVEFALPRDAEDAMFDLSGRRFGTQRIFVEWAPDSDRSRLYAMICFTS